MTDAPVASDAEMARARSAAYGLIAHGFQYPDRELVDTLEDAERWSSWPQVLRTIDGEASGRLDTVRAFLTSRLSEPGGFSPRGASAQAKACGSEGGSLGLQETFNALFGHAVRGKCPPYELEYEHGEIIQQASGLADITGFYAAFGMEVSQGAFDRPDHVSPECEFMGILCVKEAHAIETDDADHARLCTDAQRNFLKDHLGRWLPAFVHRVGEVDPDGFYGALSAFAAALVAAECRRFEITVGPQMMELKPVDPVLDTSISCGPVDGGGGDELVQLGFDSVGKEERPGG